MPTYEYACKQCGEHLEVQQSFTDEALTVCPNCSGQLRKVFGNVGVSFKGSGFYKTDSRKTGSPTAASAKSESGSDAKSGSDAPTDSKPDAKSDTKTESKSAESKPAESKPAASTNKAAS